MSGRPVLGGGVAAGHRVRRRDDGGLSLDAWAPTRADCLAEAVRALIGTFADPARGLPRRAVTLPFEPRSDDDLLVEILDEALYLAGEGGHVPVDIELQDGRDGTVVVHMVTASGAARSSQVPAAVVPYGAELRQVCGGWRCHVLVEM